MKPSVHRGEIGRATKKKRILGRCYDGINVTE